MQPARYPFLANESIFKIRVAAPEDFSRIGRLFEASYTELMREAYEPALLEAVLPRMCRANPMLLAGGTFFVAESKRHDVIGCGGWSRARPGKGDTAPGLGHVRHFATHPDHVGTGVGRALYNACEQQALRDGIRRLECYASLNAQGFYASLGFEVIERVNIAITDRVDLPAIWMTRSLPRPIHTETSRTL